MGERWVDSKVVVLGSSFVGKTCLALRYVNGSFPGDVVPTLSATYLSKSLEVNGAHLNLQLWDTAGQERFKSMAPLYFRGAHAAIICYQINSRDTFEAVKMWVEELNSKTEGNTLIVLVGTKVDLETERVISATEGAAYASSISALFFEVSAKTGQGVENLFGLLSDALVLRSARTPVTPSTSQKLTPPWRKSHHQKHC